VTLSTNLGWPSEPEPTPEHRRLGWLARMLKVSRETAGDSAPQESGVTAPAPEQLNVTGTSEASAPGPSDPGPSPSDATPSLAGVSHVERNGGSPSPEAAGSGAENDVHDPALGPPVGEVDGARTTSGEWPLATPAFVAGVAPDADSGATRSADEAPEPVDNDVDNEARNPVSEHETIASGAGDNTVDEAGRTYVLTRPESPSPGDRDALAAAIPDAGDDTPLARDLADNARRRIQLTGRPFPKPAVPRVLTVANQKGGVGKTTTTVNVAAAMAQSGLQVLVVDLDPQGNASTALGIDHHAEVPSIYDVLVDGAPLLEVVQPCTTVPGLFCAPATIDLAGAEIELVSLVARESRLQRAIGAAVEAGHAYDYILIDCPPSLGLLTVNAMVAASEVFIPIQCEYYALEGLSQLLKNIELVRAHLNPPLHVSTILLTMYDGRTRLSAQVAEEVREHFPKEVLRTTVPRSVRVSEAPSFGETVMTYDPASSGALAYLEAAGEIADRGASGPQ
jgi:cellulose biosynthesis protein BcsQ